MINIIKTPSHYKRYRKSKIIFSTVLFFMLFCLYIFGALTNLTKISSVFANSPNSWVATGSMTYARHFATAILLNSGKVLVAGGSFQGGIQSPNSESAEIYDPSTGIWTLTGSMAVGRSLHTATLLSNGKVLVAGGSFLNSAEVYDPSTGAWTPTGNMNHPRAYHTATLLPDGKVLIAGGMLNGSAGVNFFNATKTAEVYDPTTRNWTQTEDMISGHAGHTAIPLTDGRVFVAGGSDVNGVATSISEIYDPTTGQWTLTEQMISPRFLHAAVPLSSGEVLVAGGSNGSSNLNSTELFNPNTGAWISKGNLSVPYYDPSITILQSGNALIMSPSTSLYYAEVYDFASGTWSTTDNFVTPRNLSTVTLLPNGQVLAAGGRNNTGFTTSTAELYTPVIYNQAPVLDQIEHKTANEGDGYSATGAFKDSDSLSWTATVDYGDGTGSQPLTLNPDKTFSLSHTYKDNKSDNTPYTLTVSIKDDEGAEGTMTAKITVENANPKIETITIPTDPIAVNTQITANAPFTDSGVLDTHTAIWNWGDASTSGTVTQASGSGNVSDSHVYTQAGVYTITLTVTDKDLGSDTKSAVSYVVVYDPSAGFVTGGGWITSPQGAYTQDSALTGKANFGFVSKYQKGANTPSGNTEFNFSLANFNFHSTSYDWLVIAGSKAQYKGTGTINGSGNYKFILTAIDGDPDKFRLKVWDTTDNTIIYDNQSGASDTTDPTTTIGGGNIVIHK